MCQTRADLCPHQTHQTAPPTSLSGARSHLPLTCTLKKSNPPLLASFTATACFPEEDQYALPTSADLLTTVQLRRSASKCWRRYLHGGADCGGVEGAGHARGLSTQHTYKHCSLHSVGKSIKHISRFCHITHASTHKLRSGLGNMGANMKTCHAAQQEVKDGYLELHTSPLAALVVASGLHA